MTKLKNMKNKHLANLQWILFKVFGFKPKHSCGRTKKYRHLSCIQPLVDTHCYIINDNNLHEVRCRCCDTLKVSSTEFIADVYGNTRRIFYE